MVDHSKIRRIINRHDYSGKIVLDLGCGPGFGLEALVKHSPKQIIALDMLDSVLLKARLRVSADYVRGTFEEIPLRNDSVHIALSTYANFLDGDVRLRCSEVYRVLRPGGELTILCTKPYHFNLDNDWIYSLYSEKFSYVHMTDQKHLVTLIAKK
ncbi:MAG: class I SAM-dependent methyltransferase [Candidatus Woesearchaeota archaeon]